MTSVLEQLENSPSTSTEKINYLPEVYAIAPEIIANRRWFHANPELSFQEHKTAAKVVEILKSYGITEIFEGIGQTGVVALIRGGEEGPCIALRADMDALPLQETADVDYRSQNDGVMHACGHDGHISGLLAAAKVLFNERQNLRGVVKLFFQPAEEGYGGAPAMIKDGCMEEGRMGPAVDFVYGIHLWSCKSSLFLFYIIWMHCFTVHCCCCYLDSFGAGQDRLPGGPGHGLLRQVRDQREGQGRTRSGASGHSGRNCGGRRCGHRPADHRVQEQGRQTPFLAGYYRTGKLILNVVMIRIPWTVE